MAEIVQRFALVSTTFGPGNRQIVLEHILNSSGGEARPTHLALNCALFVIAQTTAPTEFWQACAIYELRIVRASF